MQISLIRCNAERGNLEMVLKRLYVYFDTGYKKNLNRLRIRGLSCHVKGSEAKSVLNTQIGSLFNQQRYHSAVFLHNCFLKRCVAEIIEGINISSSVKGCLNFREIPFKDCCKDMGL
ncbi:hypothetical protein GTA08_BOTSDO07366 [Botryosphaeria dothidea]|uniref:Uncharacterized protein n=1 Tax=Botryosphaeria dothidea TaxID=55169 RepID=A0A8H4ING1_9PEZI|nr:hypothetical protein GTA08_BOTSDO07366 [Botryosphaeria dothidea]